MIKMNMVKEWSWLLILMLAIFFLFWPFVIEGRSMQKTFENHDRIIASRILSKFELKRGDVIICKVDKKSIVKRIIALPNERVVVKNNLVLVNGEVLKEPYVLNKTFGNVEFDLGKDEYFVMGDNRNISRDSRNFGPIKKSSIKAKVLFRFFPTFSFVNYNWEAKK